MDFGLCLHDAVDIPRGWRRIPEKKKNDVCRMRTCMEENRHVEEKRPREKKRKGNRR
jgi:hypothetical protein